MWCVPKLDRQYVQRMEDVLNLLERPVNEREPVVVLDERPVQLRADARPGIPATPGSVARRDYEYVRHGTANVFAITAPKIGRHQTHATRNRTARSFARAMKKIATAHAKVKTIHIVMDNLNTHCAKSLTDTFGLKKGRALWGRFTVHYTPKHGSWLNPAELEVSLWASECLGRDRIATLAELKSRTRAWNARANREHRTITWRFTTADARRLFRYKRSTAHRSRH
jgi:phenylalanyl-tRNA synthetase alpha subunit